MSKLEVMTVAYQKKNAGDLVTIRLSPDDNPGDLREKPLGTRFAMAFVEISDDETTPPWDEDAP